MTIGSLLVLFKEVSSASRIPTPRPFVGFRYAPASSRTGRGNDLEHLVAQKCPALLSTEFVLVCSPRDRSNDKAVHPLPCRGVGVLQSRPDWNEFPARWPPVTSQLRFRRAGCKAKATQGAETWRAESPAGNGFAGWRSSWSRTGWIQRLTRVSVANPALNRRATARGSELGRGFRLEVQGARAAQSRKCPSESPRPADIAPLLIAK
jgi:hypothetical protein